MFGLLLDISNERIMTYKYEPNYITDAEFKAIMESLLDNISENENLFGAG